MLRLYIADYTFAPGKQSRPAKSHEKLAGPAAYGTLFSANTSIKFRRRNDGLTVRHLRERYPGRKTDREEAQRQESLLLLHQLRSAVGKGKPGGGLRLTARETIAVTFLNDTCGKFRAVEAR